MPDPTTPERALPAPSRPYIVGVERPSRHGDGYMVREQIAAFKDRADAALFLKSYNLKVDGTSYYRASLWEIQYVR